MDAVVEASMCALLRGESPGWSLSRGPEFDARLRDCAAHHGVRPLLSRQLTLLRPCERKVDEPRELAQELRNDMATELIRSHELNRVLRALAESGVTALLLKGAALAYSVYASPALRPRADSDVLIREADRDVTVRTLSRLGYERPNANAGDLVTYQCAFVLRDRFHIDHVLDVHWRVSNTQAFSRALSYDELRSRVVALPALGDHARALAPVDALLLACMHRVHHIHSPYWVDGAPTAGGERLIWIYDIHLLVEAMSNAELAEFVRLAEGKGMRAVCGDGILRACRYFGTQVPDAILLRLLRSGPTEHSAPHLRPGRLRHSLTELRSLPRWRDRITLLGEHLFPPAHYMLEKYSVASRAWLPMLYLQRVIQGTWRRIQGSL